MAVKKIDYIPYKYEGTSADTTAWLLANTDLPNGSMYEENDGDQLVYRIHEGVWSEFNTQVEIQAINTGGYYPECGMSQLNASAGDENSLRLDSSGNLQVRGPITTDEGSFREGFPANLIYNNLPGSCSFTNGSDQVTTTGDFLNGTLQIGDYVKFNTDTEAMYAQIVSIDSSNSLTLEFVYPGVTGTGVGHVTKMKTITGTGGAISTSAATSLITIGSGVSINAKTNVSRTVDYCPIIVLFNNVIVSQRIVNQSGIIGLVDDPLNSYYGAYFMFDGAVNTTIKTVSQLGTGAANTETTNVTMPLGGNTGTAHRYRVELTQETCTFYIDETVVAVHRNHIPTPYSYMDVFAGWINAGVSPASTTTFTIDSVFVNNCNALQVQFGFAGMPAVVAGANTAGTPPTAPPVMVGGYDGTNVQRIRTNTGGTLLNVPDGVVASGSADSGNPLKTGGKYNSALPTFATGNRGDTQIDAKGKTHVTPSLSADALGYTVSTLQAAATTNAVNLKATAGVVAEVSAVNNAAYTVFIKLFNKATTPVPGTDVAYRVIAVPAGQTVVVTYPMGAFFSAGIGYAVTKLVGYADTTALVANDLQMSIQWI